MELITWAHKILLLKMNKNWFESYVEQKLKRGFES